MAKELPKRNEVKVEHTWKLADLYAQTKDWENDLSKIVAIGDEIALYEGKVGASATNLFLVLNKVVELELIVTKAYHYAERLYDEDTSNTAHQAMSAKIGSVYAEIGSKTAFLDPEILAIEDAGLEEFYKEEQGLLLYKDYISEIRRLKEHTLSAEMEKLVALTFEMSQTAGDTFSVLSNADMTFPEVIDDQGEKVRITHGRFVRMLESGNRAVRENTFEKYYETYKSFANTFASLYDGQVKQQIFYAKAKNYNSTLEAALFGNNVSTKVYYNLIEAVNEHMYSLHNYVKLRKKCLDVEELHMYDIYTPMISDIAKKVSYEEAKATALEALAPLGDDYLSVVKEAFDNRWIDVYENQGKRSGAYSACAYGTHPFMLLNYNDSLDDMFTLVHEMGHSMHSYYSDKKQPFIYSQYKIFVAEVASTVNELLLLEYLLNQVTDTKERAYLLNHYLDMFKGTLFRQTQFAEFELRTNEMVEAGEGLNADNLCGLYKELNEKYYGPDMISDEQIAYEWARIPHFYYNYYVYQYATSFSASVKIAHDLLSGDENVAKQYREFLSSGCSKPPVELLKMVGVDMETAAPFTAALDVMDEVLKEMEECV